MTTIDWLDFAEEIKFNNRFLPQNNKILQVIDEIFDKRIEILEKGSKFFRARITELSNMEVQDKILMGFPEEGSMAPDAKIATAQRASPEKISYLYVAQDEYTALSEIRPGLLSFISLAELESVDELRILDLWVDINSDISLGFEELATSFSAVIAEKEKGIDYLPMQFVAEYIKNKGADGIRYASFQSQGGKNVVIFSKEKISFIQSKVMYNQNIAYSFLDLTNPERKHLVNAMEHEVSIKEFANKVKNTVLAIQAKK